METRPGHEKVLPTLGLLGKANIPAHLIIGNIVHCLASPHTVFTADANAKIDYHAPLVIAGDSISVCLTSYTFQRLG
jgi:hypothetical protein